MRAVIQRVTQASVEVEGRVTGRIDGGLAVLIGVGTDDSENDCIALSRKVLSLRIFDDETGRMNRSVLETGGSILVVSQFTLYADLNRGKRPSFHRAAPPQVAVTLYEYFVRQLRASKVNVQTGIFQAAMKLHLINDGPVTLICDSVTITATEKGDLV